MRDGVGLHKFDKCLEYRLTQAKRMAAVWRRRCQVWMFDARITIRLFNACVMPVLDYAVGIWRPGKFEQREWMSVEQFWRASARSILGVPLRTPVAGMFGDLGWRRYATRAAWFAVCFWARVTRMPDKELTRQAMRVQRRLLDSGKSCWLREFAPTLKSTPSGVMWWRAWWDDGDNDFRLRCADVIENDGKTTELKWETIFLQEVERCEDLKWTAQISSTSGVRGQGGNKLRTYALFKENVGLEPYLWRVQESAHRRLISQVRMGVAPLRIELGRYEYAAPGQRGLPVEERVCQVCSCGSVEDELHFVIKCPAYVNERQCLFAACHQCRSFQAEWIESDVERLFCFVMREAKVASALGSFLFRAFQKRELLLSSARLVGSARLSAGR